MRPAPQDRSLAGKARNPSKTSRIGRRGSGHARTPLVLTRGAAYAASARNGRENAPGRRMGSDIDYWFCRKEGGFSAGCLEEFLIRFAAGYWIGPGRYRSMLGPTGDRRYRSRIFLPSSPCHFPSEELGAAFAAGFFSPAPERRRFPPHEPATASMPLVAANA